VYESQTAPARLLPGRELLTTVLAGAMDGVGAAIRRAVGTVAA
jgi:hypothetical protein